MYIYTGTFCSLSLSFFFFLYPSTHMYAHPAVLTILCIFRLQALSHGPSDLTARRDRHCALELLPYLELNGPLIAEGFREHETMSIILDEVGESRVTRCLPSGPRKARSFLNQRPGQVVPKHSVDFGRAWSWLEFLSSVVSGRATCWVDSPPELSTGFAYELEVCLLPPSASNLLMS